MNNSEQHEAIELLENKTAYTQSELLALAQRDKNTKRKFLLVNRKQGKHLAAAPAEVLALFAQLGQIVQEKYGERRVAVIGFAETATAIGAAVAAQFTAPVLLLQTSREELLEDNLVDFQEEHSHATEQKLYCTHQEQLLNAEVVLFVEDEVTTGNTIWNFIQALRQAHCVAAEVQFAVASLVNSLTDELLDSFAVRGVCYHYLVRGCYHAELDPYPHLTSECAWQPPAILAEQTRSVLWQIGGKLESRCGIDSHAYQQACLALSQELVERLMAAYGQLDGHILVLGSEELMYPAIVAADVLQKQWPDSQVLTHATTRSPIKISQEAPYPIFNGCCLPSLYEAGRTTFVYNLCAYDWVIWLTDAENLQLAGVQALVQALEHFGCKKIIGVRWSHS